SGCIGRNGGTVVGYLYTNTFLRITISFQGDLSVGSITYGLNRIFQQIRNHLGYQVLVGKDYQVFPGFEDGKGDVGAWMLVLCQSDHPFQERTDIEQRWFR